MLAILDELVFHGSNMIKASCKFNGTSIYSSGGKWSEHIDPDRRINEWMDGWIIQASWSRWLQLPELDASIGMAPSLAIVRCSCSSHKPSHQPASSSQPDAAWRIRCTRCGQAHHRACENGAWHHRPGPQHCRDEKAISEAFSHTPLRASATHRRAGHCHLALCCDPQWRVRRMRSSLKRYAQSIEGAMNVSEEYCELSAILIFQFSVFLLKLPHILFTTGWL